MTVFAEAAGSRAAIEVQIEGRERPADIFVDKWTTADPASLFTSRPSVRTDASTTAPSAANLQRCCRICSTRRKGIVDEAVRCHSEPHMEAGAVREEARDADAARVGQ